MQKCRISVSRACRRRLSYPSVSRLQFKVFHPSTLLRSSSLLQLLLCVTFIHPPVTSTCLDRPSVSCFFTSHSPIRRLLLYVTFACYPPCSPLLLWSQFFHPSFASTGHFRTPIKLYLLLSHDTYHPHPSLYVKQFVPRSWSILVAYKLKAVCC